MKKFAVPLIAIAVVVSIILAGCAGPAPTAPTEPTAPTAPTAPTEPTTPTEPAPELRGWGPLQGVAQKPDGSPYVFGHVNWALNNDFPICMDMNIKSLMERAGGECISLDPDNVLETQLAMFEDLATREVDGIIFLPVDSQGTVPTIERITAQGIPFFNVDHAAETDATITFSTHDQVDCGRVGAQYLVDWARDHGETLVVYEVWGKTGHEGSERRHEGYHEIFDANPDVIENVIESGNTEWATDAAMQFVLEALPAHPEISAICTHNNMVAGVVEALRMLDRLYPVGDPNHIPYVAIDEFGISMKHLRDGYCDSIAVHSPWEESEAATMAFFMYACCGMDVPSEVILTSEPITLENADAVRFGSPLVWGEMMLEYPDANDWPLLEYPPEYGIIIPTADMKPSDR